MWKTSRSFLDCNPLDNTFPDFQMVVRGSGSLDRLEMDQLALGQLHWSTVNYAPFQEQALWDGLIAVYEQGLVKAIGVSNYGPKQLVRIHKYLQRRGVPLSSVQVNPKP
jgi:pyridoxine 4-dehydrogenase